MRLVARSLELLRSDRSSSFHLLSLALFVCAMPAWAQDPIHRQYTKQDGLPSNTIYSVLQDRQGFMWFGTDAGASRFDGRNFRNLTVRDGLTDNNVIAFASDSKGRVWFLTLNGRLSFFLNDSIHNESNDPALAGFHATMGWQSFAEDAEGLLWFGGIYTECLRLDLNGDRDSLFQFPGGKVSVVADRYGAVQVINGGTIYQQQQLGWTIQRTWNNDLFYSPVHRMAADGSGRTLSLSTAGINVLVEGGWTRMVPFEARSDEHTLSWIDAAGDLWIRRAFDGVEHFPREGDVWRAPQRLFADDVVNDVHVDDEGGRWFCTARKGVYYANAAQFAGRVFRSAVERPAESMLTILGLADGRTLVGTMDGSLYEFDGYALKTISLSDAGRILDMVEDRAGRVWIASDRTLGLWSGSMADVQDVGGFLSEVNPDLPCERALAKSVTIAPNGQAWCGSFGLQKVEWKNGRPSRTALWHLPVRDRVLTMHADERGRVWFASNATLHYVRNDSIFPQAQLTGKTGSRISDIVGFDEDGLVVSTTGAGVLLLDPDANLLGQLTTVDGLLSDDVSRVRVHGDTLLVITKQGLNVVVHPLMSKQQGRTILSRTDLPVDEVNDALYIDDKLLVATGAGLCVLGPTVPAFTNTAPRTYFSGIWANGLPVVDPSAIHLDEGQASLRVAFQAITFNAPEEVEYAYRLNSARPWTVFTEGTLDLASLSAGIYAMEFRARNADGEWSVPQVLHAEVLPPWWRRTPARVFAVLSIMVFLVALTGALSRRRYRAELAALRQREAINVERQRIAADVHDDLGAELGRVLLHARQLEARPGPDAGFPFSKSIGSAINKIDEIIWSLDPRRDTLQATIAFVEQQAQELLGLKDIAFRTAVDLPADDVPLPAEARRELMLVLREALHNVVKHANATEVWLRCSMYEGVAVCLLEDNGVGIGTAPKALDRNGLVNLHARADRLNGSLFISPILPHGTRVELRWPIP